MFHMKLGVVTTMSHFAKYTPIFLLSCIENDIHPVVLTDCKGWGVEKTKTLGKYILSLDPNAGDLTHLLVCDSFDVIFRYGKDEIMRRYLNFTADIVSIKDTECTRYPKYQDKFKTYPNSGVW